MQKSEDASLKKQFMSVKTRYNASAKLATPYLAVALNLACNVCWLCKKCRICVESARAIFRVLHVAARVTARKETGKYARSVVSCGNTFSIYKMCPAKDSRSFL